MNLLSMAEQNITAAVKIEMRSCFIFKVLLMTKC